MRLARFVMQNNYFSYNNQYYHQIRGGAMGSPLTLTIANCYMFFFESPVGSIDRDQCERRIWRQGQRNRCFIYDLLMKDSVDSRIIMFHSHAANLFEALVKDPSLIEEGFVKE